MQRSSIIILCLSTLVFGLPEPKAQQRELIAGPYRLERSSGGPDSFTRSFDVCDPQGSFWLVAENGDADGEGRISSARISVNGVEVLRPQDLNQQVARIERAVNLTGHNTLDASTTSKPGGFLTVRIEGITNCLRLGDIEPPSGSVMPGDKVYIRGKVRTQAREVVIAQFYDGYEEPENGGILFGRDTLFGSGEFAIGPILIGTEQPRVIHLRVRDEAGNTYRETVTYTGTQLLHDFSIRANIWMGTAPQRVEFSIDAGSLRIRETGQEGVSPKVVRIDFDGDGVFDWQGGRERGSWPHPEHVYEEEGLYHLKGELLGSEDELLATTYATVQIINDAPFDEKFMEMVEHLAAGLRNLS